jgi:catechol 2,3-dioxygenase-like lactoylglutathione lyase family enzyme
MINLEHVNITVADPKASAKVFQDLFGWQTRWEGASLDGAGYTVHVGTETTYLALYTGTNGVNAEGSDNSYQTRAAMNHIAVVVDDLDALEKAVTAKGFTTHSHADYEPGRRFYFHDGNGIEIEVVCYD